MVKADHTQMKSRVYDPSRIARKQLSSEPRSMGEYVDSLIQICHSMKRKLPLQPTDQSIVVNSVPMSYIPPQGLAAIDEENASSQQAHKN
jgi:hypothetical protein